VDFPWIADHAFVGNGNAEATHDGVAHLFRRTDPWALQDEVTGQIIATLAGETGQLKKAQYREAWGKDSLEEYDYYLRGHDIFLSAMDKAQADRAGEIWREGLAKYPDSDLLKISLGWYHYMSPFSFWSDDPAADYRAAGKLSREVLAHDNLSPLVRKLAHWLMAFVLAQERNFEGARKEANGAAELAPYDAQMLDHLAVVKLMVGEVDEALEWLDSADARDPSLAEISNYRRGWAYTLQNRNEQAVAALKRGTEFVDTRSCWP
jgi:adenylate cyclase